MSFSPDTCTTLYNNSTTPVFEPGCESPPPKTQLSFWTDLWSGVKTVVGDIKKDVHKVQSTVEDEVNAVGDLFQGNTCKACHTAIDGALTQTTDVSCETLSHVASVACFKEKACEDAISTQFDSECARLSSEEFNARLKNFVCTQTLGVCKHKKIKPKYVDPSQYETTPNPTPETWTHAKCARLVPVVPDYYCNQFNMIRGGPALMRCKDECMSMIDPNTPWHLKMQHGDKNVPYSSVQANKAVEWSIYHRG